METVNYSLNNKNTYVIKTYDKYNQNNTKNKIILNNTEIKYDNTEIKLNNTNIKYDNPQKQKTNKYNNTHIFDKHCIELYGDRTCILFHIDLLNIEIRLLDHIRYNKNNGIKYTNKKSLYNEIPNLLKNNYTVILVEYLENTSTYEITTIHLPPK